MLYVLYITNMTKCFRIKSVCAIQVVKRLKEDWFVVLQKELQLCSADKVLLLMC